MDSLILIPTEIERKLFRQHGARENLTVQRCGFGPVVAAARAAFLIAKHNPSRCLLVGIAGVYPTSGAELKIGTAATFNSVGCFGVGAGSGEGFQTAEQMGWQQWPPTDTENAIGDSLELFVPETTSTNHATVVGQLLTVTSAAANETEVQQRRRLFPDAVAEDMEGFAVAAACHLAGIPLTIVRGFSNLAGDRNHSNWQIETAMEAAAELVDEIKSQT